MLVTVPPARPMGKIDRAGGRQHRGAIRLWGEDNVTGQPGWLAVTRR
ncbi:hypothetical protein [Actinokineospora globicatena]|nr:hypothetical protein [Actinokineospora globicatena]